MQVQQKKQYNHQILNIKGLSWMLKGTDTGTTTNSSHVSTMNDHFKIFKLKDQTKKWKKKTNKKFQGVGVKIQTVLKSKMIEPQPFSQNFLTIIKSQYVPHLQIIVSDDSQKQNIKDIKQKQQIINEIKQKYNISQLKTEGQMNKQVMKLMQSYQSISNNCKKISKIKNIGKIYQKKKQLFEQTINEFFLEEQKTALQKIQKYKNFNIQQYQNQIIQSNIQNSNAASSEKNSQKFQNPHHCSS